MNEQIQQLNQEISSEAIFIPKLLGELSKVIVGQSDLLEKFLIALLTEGHVLIEGVPGLGKTLAIKTLAEAVQLDFKRIQFTPDLLPADILGTMIYRQDQGEFIPKLGPVFTNFVLADEINRAPAKVQSALLEAMQEKQVSIGDKTYPIEGNFMVLATQNPLDQEGTYPLPEAQIDRFLMKLLIKYPTREEEQLIINRMTNGSEASVSPVIQEQDIQRAKQVCRRIYVDNKIKDYVIDLVFATREPESSRLEELAPLIEHGASPRASIALINASKARAFIKQRGYVIPEDVKAVAKDVLRHRVIPSFEADASEMSSDDILDKLLNEIAVP